MRHWVSLAAMAGFAGLAWGSGGGATDGVSVSGDAPPSVTVGEPFPCSVEVDNQGDAALIVDHVVVSANGVRALDLRVPGAPAEAFGDDRRFSITPLTVPAGGTQRIKLEGTPYLSGSQSHRVEVCTPEDRCHTGRVATQVNGGAERAVTIDWSLPARVQAGVPFEISVDLRNESGGPDLVESVGYQRSTGDWLERLSSQPAALSQGDNIGRTTWRHDLALEPGAGARITWTAQVATVGAHDGKLSVCIASEAFCVDEDITVIATSVPVDAVEMPDPIPPPL